MRMQTTKKKKRKEKEKVKMPEIDSGVQRGWVQSCDRCQDLISRKRDGRPKCWIKNQTTYCSRQQQKMALEEAEFGWMQWKKGGILQTGLSKDTTYEEITVYDDPRSNSFPHKTLNRFSLCITSVFYMVNNTTKHTHRGHACIFSRNIIKAN